jgi:homoaconitase/3-isopropylmalate dehydratase large subunit
MDVMRTGVSALGCMLPEKDDHNHPGARDIADRLMASLGSMLLYWYHWSRRASASTWKPTTTPSAALPAPAARQQARRRSWVRAMHTSLNLYAEHEFNASTFTARVVAGTGSDMHSAITGAIGALRGPKHGGANEVAFEIQKRYDSPDEAEADIRRRVEAKEVVIGFGHPVYTVSDPRNVVIKGVAKSLSRRSRLDQDVRHRRAPRERDVGGQEDVPQPRLVQRRELPHDGRAHGHVHAAVRHRAHLGLGGARHRAAHRQQDHPPERQLHRAGRPEVRADPGPHIERQAEKTKTPALAAWAQPGRPMNNEYRKNLPGTSLDYFDAREAVEALRAGAWATLPYTSRVHAENLVRRCDPALLVRSLTQIVERRRDHDFPWFPARVVCHDILGQTALVDLAGLRDAIAEQGGDPAQVNPVVPVQLIVDHSLAVECGGFDPDAFAKNRAIEDRRNEDRFHFIEWTKRAFKNMEVIPPGNGIMHQINLERMSPVVHAQDGVAFPDTLVGTDSHTPHVDALGVVAIGVGGLEAENVMLGRASWMRLPVIVGVKLEGPAATGITATDVVLALTEFLRQQKVVGAYLEFHGEGASSLTLGDRATISNMAPEYGATAAMFAIDADHRLPAPHRPRRRAGRLVETYAKHTGLWADALKARCTSACCGSTSRRWCATWPARRTRMRAWRPRELAARGIAAPWTDEPGRMPDGAVIIAAITSCTNTSNPRNVIAAGLLARNANRVGLARKPWVKTSLAPGSKAVTLYLQEAGLMGELEQLGFGMVAYACTTCNGMSGALDPAIQQEIVERDLYATAVLSGNRNFDGRIHPYAKQAFLASPPLVVAYAIAGTIASTSSATC